MCYSSTSGTTFSNVLVIFLSFDLILLFQTLNYEEILYKNSLTYLTLVTNSQTYVSIMANFILDSLFLCCAWLCYHTHVYTSLLSPPCSCLMFLL